MTVWNDLPGHAVEGGIMVELGDLWAGEERKLVLTFDVPGEAALGLAQIAELELRYVALPDLAEQTVTMPVHVNVVPGDQAAGRIARPEGAHRARLPAGAGRQAQGVRRAARRRPRRRRRAPTRPPRRSSTS